MRSLNSVPKAERGFTLIEILVAVAIMAMLAGAAIPVASKALSSAARKATREELVQVGAAAQEYFRDTNQSPKKVLDLERKSKAPGWAGPYVSGAMQDPLATTSPYTTDAWSREYRAKVSGDVLTITSAGPDASFDTDDDVKIQVDFTPIRREETLEELKTLNQAIGLYNGLYGADKPLPSAWKKSLTMLVDAGFLPDYDVYYSDSWGNAYVGEPDGKSPLVKVASSSIANTTKTHTKLDDGGPSKGKSGKGDSGQGNGSSGDSKKSS